jgi:predicted enzyme related to lactoylglutathione lyase
MKNAISWFEIPTNDLNRATKFYETVLDAKFIPLELDAAKLSMFPVDDMTGVGGALVEGDESNKPSITQGTLIYLNANPDLQVYLDRVEGAGGKILQSKISISPEYGSMALIQDTEGNRIGLHSVE